jgi:uncharacterized damage-inducible protein DinB
VNAVDILKYGHQTLLNSFNGLPEEDWHSAGVCGVWSVQDILAHLASYEQVLIEVLNSLLNDSPTPTLERFGQLGLRFNDVEVEARRGKTVGEVLAEYQDAHTQTVALLAQIPAETRRQNGTLPWYGSDYDLDDFIVYTFYGHKREHSAQIAVFRDQLVDAEAVREGTSVDEKKLPR